jgi:acetyl esterase/lipase
VIRRLALALAAAMALLAAPALAAGDAAAREEIRLWPGTPPGNGKVTGEEKIGGEGSGLGAVSNVSVPRMRVYRPTVPNGAAVLVAGGGGYFRIQLKKESTPAAEWLAAQGFTVFELIYRLPNDGWDSTAPFMDAQRAMKIIRTRREIVGDKASEAAEIAWSLDTYASKDAPPTIIFAAADDPTTPPGHGILLFQSLIAAGASAELHLFRNGGHGWGLGTPDQVISQWPGLFAHWAQSLQITKKRGE